MRVRWTAVLLFFLLLLPFTASDIPGAVTSKPTRPAALLADCAFEDVAPGMTLEEVIAVVGVPPGDYSRRSGETPMLCVFGMEPVHKGIPLLQWRTDSRIVTVWFDTGKVVCVSSAFFVVSDPLQEPVVGPEVEEDRPTLNELRPRLTPWIKELESAH